MRKQAGFTLLEVVLAFSLLAVSLGLLIAILSGGLRQVRQSADLGEASLHAQSLLDSLGVLEPLQPGLQQGEFEQGRYRWTLQVDEVPAPLPGADAAAPPGEPPASVPAAIAPVLYRVQLDVAWGEGGAARTLHLATLRARMPRDPAGARP